MGLRPPDDNVIVNGLIRARAGAKVAPHRQKARRPPPLKRRPIDMRLSRFFIDRPIFAAVVSIVFVIVGAVALARLPFAQYPDIATAPGAGQRAVPGRERGRCRQYSRGAARARDQRRREHALHHVERNR